MQSGTVAQIQQLLKEKGFDAGTADGIWGRRTIAAIKAFQREAGIGADGIFGPQTSAALFDDHAGVTPETVLPWILEAEHLINTREFRGADSNPIIVNWAIASEIPYKGDDVPWCGLFVAHCIGATLPDEVLPDNPLGARQWSRFGEKTQPRPGAVMAFSRDGPHSGKGHVGFYVAQNDAGDKFKILGGNQSDEVGYAWVSSDVFIEARWPRSATSLTGNLKVVEANFDKETDTSFA